MSVDHRRLDVAMAEQRSEPASHRSGKRDLQDFPIEEEYRVERLMLSGGGSVSVHRESAEEFSSGAPNSCGTPAVMENVPSNPLNISLLCGCWSA